MAIACLILFCCVQMANAQPYQSIFGDNTTQFNVFVPCLSVKSMCDGYDDELGGGYTKHISFNQENDTIINGQTYKIGNIPGSGVIFFDAYVREDMLTGKIYSYFPRCNKEYLVCDLSLHVGDTFYFNKCTYSDTIPDGYMIADSVTYFEGKKIIYFKDIIQMNPYLWIPFSDKIFFMESIGSTFVFFDSSDGCGEGFNLLLCAYKNNDLVYIRNPESSYGCDYNCMGSNINEYSKNNLHAYPNPAYSTFQIKGIDDFQNYTVSIYNMYGQLIMQKQIVNENDIIHIENLSKGVYIVNLSSKNNVVTTSKLIKL